MKRKQLGGKTKPAKVKVKKTKTSTAEELGLTGEETASQLYVLYIQARMGSNEKLISKLKVLWSTKYYEEKANGKKK